MAAKPLPSQGPKRRRKCYITRAFSGVPKQKDKIRSSDLLPPKKNNKRGTLFFLIQKKACMFFLLHNLCFFDTRRNAKKKGTGMLFTEKRITLFC